MKVAKLEFIPASIPYKHREVSYQVQRNGVTDVIIKATTDHGLFGWGESCSGANVESLVEALKAMAPFVLGRSPWESEAIRRELWHHGVWIFRKPTASFAYAGIDIALWDVCVSPAVNHSTTCLAGRSGIGRITSITSRQGQASKSPPSVARVWKEDSRYFT